MRKRKLSLWVYMYALMSLIVLLGSCKKEDTGELPLVTTGEISEISDVTALSGGTVTSKGGSKLVALGLCYSKENAEPTVSDVCKPYGEYTIDGILETDWNFSTTMEGLVSNTTYHVRAYSANEDGTSYGAVKTFTTKKGKTFHTLTPGMIECYTQEPTEGPKENLIDGNISNDNYWTSDWSSASGQPLPHYIQITFSEPQGIGGIQYWLCSSWKDDNPDSWDLQTSTDCVTYTTVWVSPTNLPVNICTPQVNTLSMDKNYTSKYFRIRMLTTPNMNPYTQLTELKVFYDGLLDK